MISKELYQEPSIKAFEVLTEGVVCDSDVVVVRVDYGEAQDGEW